MLLQVFYSRPNTTEDDTEGSHQRCSIKKAHLEISQNLQKKHLCQSLFFNKVAGLRPATLLKNRLVQVFSYEFREISKNNFFAEHLWMTASDNVLSLDWLSLKE